MLFFKGFVANANGTHTEFSPFIPSAKGSFLNTFCPLQMWDRTKPTQSFNVKVPSGTTNPSIVVKAYNNYEKDSTSAPVTVNASFVY